jgi:hypothetical protein
MRPTEACYKAPSPSFDWTSTPVSLTRGRFMTSTRALARRLMPMAVMASVTDSFGRSPFRTAT